MDYDDDCETVNMRGGLVVNLLLFVMGQAAIGARFPSAPVALRIADVTTIGTVSCFILY